MSASATILESKVICKQPGRYIGWPTVAKTPDGVLWVVFSGDRDRHICPFGKTFALRSMDGGATWSAPELITNTPLDDRDAGILACTDGTLIVSWFTSHYITKRYLEICPVEERDRRQRHLSTISEADVAQWTQHRADDGVRRVGHWIRRSTDGGQSWDEPIVVPPSTPHGPIEMTDGRLLYLGTGGYDRVGQTSALLVAESRDTGRTWAVIARVNMFPAKNEYLCEPHLVEVAPGRLLAMARHETRPYRAGRRSGVLWQFESSDGGYTWTEPRPTEILGKPPHLIKLRDGRVLVTFGYRHAPFGQRACLSKDDGQTWDSANVIVLRDDGGSVDLGYPASVELDDGTILTVYYQIDQPGEKTCLMSTRWMISGHNRRTRETANDRP